MYKLFRYKVGALVAIVIIISAGTLTFWSGHILQAASGQLSMFTRILRDDALGNAAGWDPDGSKRSFTILEPEFAASDNMILINTVQNNFVVCSVDYRGDRFFEVNCIETTPGFFPGGNMTVLAGGPADGAILYYTVINSPVVPLRGPPLPDVLAQVQNQTAGRGPEDSQPQ